jgi:hypothetical protein
MLLQKFSKLIVKQVEERKTNYGLKNEKAIINFLDENL